MNYISSNRKSFFFTVLVAAYVVCLIVANIIAGKMWAAPLGLLFPAGVLCFPIVYIIGDVVPEVYGISTAKKVICLGFAANLLAVLLFTVTLLLPAPVWWENQSSFEVVLGFTPRLLLASLVAYLCGSTVNAYIMVWVKKLTNEKWLWMRTISSTIVGEFVDSAIFVTVAFAGILEPSAIVTAALSQWAFKTIYEAVMTPVTYLVINRVKKVELKWWGHND